MRRSNRKLRRAALLGVALAPAAARAATITVNSLNDGPPAVDGKCTLREAIQNANNNAATNPDCASGSGADTIVFTGLSGMITLTNGQLKAGESLTIQGPGASQLTINGNNLSRIFYLYQSGGSLPSYTISGLTLTNGNSATAPIDTGGAIVASANLTLDSVTITNSSGTYTGAVIVARNAPVSLTINNSTITGNTAQTQGAVQLYTHDGSLSISHSTISNNNTTQAVAGGILVDNEGTTGSATIQNTIISGNTAKGEGGGAIFVWPGTLTIQDSAITGNTAMGKGGGFDSYHDPGTVAIKRSTISGNSASDGGAIRANLLTIENSTIFGNSASNLGGAIRGVPDQNKRNPSLTLSLSTITGNSAVVAGGNIDLYGGTGGTLTLSNSIVANGTAPTNPDINLSGTGSTVTSNYSLIKTPGSTPIAGANNMTGVDPNLGALANNGSTITAGAPGATQNPQTELPNGGSPVIDAGDPAFAGPPLTDERGLARVNNGRVDMGADEVQQAPATAIPLLGGWAKILLAMSAAFLGWFKLGRE